MINLFRKKNKQRIWHFKGGIHPPEMKHQSKHIPLRRLPLAKHFIVPLTQHIGEPGNVLVKKGDTVLKGQALTQGKMPCLPVHAPTSGIVSHIGPATVAHPSGLSDICITIDADGKDEWIPHKGIDNYQTYPPHTLINYLHQSGIAGLGGAGFPTAEKLINALSQIEILIINGAECEPYITADDRLMQEHAKEIVEGCIILQHILKPKLTIIGIEDNKPEAIASMTKAISGLPNIIVRVIPTKYPSGGAKQLTKILTGREVPYNQHSAHIGVLMQNVGTVFAIQRAILHGEPLIERVVTLTGNAIGKKGNVWLPIGTPIKHVLAQCDFDTSSISCDQTPRLIMGGPLMGFVLPHSNVPIVKITNCLLAPDNKEIPLTDKEQPCIRCGLCIDACPTGLLPHQLYWFSKSKEHEKAEKYSLNDCIECGACAYVCPSNIPLVHYYRQEKFALREIKKDTIKKQQTKIRFEAKKQRIEQQKQLIAQKHKQAAIRTTEYNKDAIQAALSRIRQKQNLDDKKIASNEIGLHQNNLSTVSNGGNNIKSTMLVEAIARAKARKAQLQTTSHPNDKAPLTTDTAVSPTDPTETQQRKHAVSEAIARAKARKAQLQATSHPNDKAPLTTDTAVSPTDPTETQQRKHAVSDIIKYAKEKNS